jgi:hypothetical protein
MPSDDSQQLDLFADSRDVMLRNDAIEAVLRGDIVGARRAGDALAEFDARDAALAPIATLIAALEAAAAAVRMPFGDPALAMAAHRHLAETVAPAARQLLRGEAAHWLAPMWRSLAERCAALPYRAEQSEAHAAANWLLGGEFDAAARAVLTIESWRRIPQPLAWMVQARHAVEGLDTTWPLVAELAWLSPRRLAEVLPALQDPLLDRLRRRFELDFEPEDASGHDEALAWFPAWVLNDQPALLPRLRVAEPGLDSLPERAFRSLCELLGLERQGRHAELVAGRKRLRALAPALYAVYMKTR